MAVAGILRHAVGLVVPPRCATCGRGCAATAPLCCGCERALARLEPGAAPLADVGVVVWAAPYRGVARDLVAGLKFARRLALAGVAAAAIASAGDLLTGAVVPVPAAPARRRRRGFDPAELIAVELARLSGLPLRICLARRDGPRQVGRRRAERIALPPRVRACGGAPRSALLVDDVLTTGATLRSCATALRAAGCEHVGAAVFARALGSAVPAA